MPECDDGDMDGLFAWMQSPVEAQPASQPLGLGLPPGDNEDDEEVQGITDASPKWCSFGLAPVPSALVDGMEFGAGAVPPSTPFDADAAMRAAVFAVADNFPDNYSLFNTVGTDLAPRESFGEPRFDFYGEEEAQHQEYTPYALPQHDAPQPCVDPRTANITVDTLALQPAPAAEPEPTPEPEPARAQTKKRKRGAESGPATKKTRKANGAGASGSGNAGPATSPIIMSIPLNPTFKQLCDLLDISQVWRPLTEPAPALPDGILCRALAIRPSTGGNNGRVLKNKRAAETLTIDGCCGHTNAQSSTNRHTTTVRDHYPRLREHALTKAEFKFFWCECGHKQERKDIFVKRHPERKTCPRRNDDSDDFCHRLEDPETRDKAWQHLMPQRDEAILKALQRLPCSGVTDQNVSELMSAWDVVPDLICEVLREEGYICYNEAAIEARDVAVDNT
ncbi:hypothetical protein PENSPDRAFT_656953 [Peniophora sp. CONT]|nr:hypothetical protein PENSPDRAFT_656953 [Peniophora sp. CONT]